jgi:hypothetical protein
MSGATAANLGAPTATDPQPLECEVLRPQFRDAFTISRRQLQGYAKRIRGEVKTHASDLNPYLETTGQ